MGRLVQHYLWSDNPEWPAIGLPARCDPDTPYFHIEFEVDGGTAAGGAWINLIIVDCIDQDLIGKTICCEADSMTGGYRLTYHACRQWDGGFVSNCPGTELVPYREGEDNDEGTPMGGEVIPDLDGLQVWVPDEMLHTTRHKIVCSRNWPDTDLDDPLSYAVLIDGRQAGQCNVESHDDIDICEALRHWLEVWIAGAPDAE